MLRNLTTACVRRKTATEHVQRTSKRFRTTGTTTTKSSWSNRDDKPRSRPYGSTHNKSSFRPSYSGIQRVHSPFLEQKSHKSKSKLPLESITPETCGDFFQSSIKQWTTSLRTLQRFQRWGFATEDIKPILDVYVQTALSGFFTTPANQAKYQLTRFADSASSKPMTRQLDAEILFSNIFFAWCRDTQDSAILDQLASTASTASSPQQNNSINPNTVATLRHLAEVSQRRPAEDFPYARRLQRKFIMHVGPTNSGKTHHALRALAAAKTGVYAGPLRLLAHEIWERLNLGQIAPLGVEQPPPNIIDATPTDNDDCKGGVGSILKNETIPPQAQKLYNPAYARPTNMVTGEERKIVAEDAGLVSCTVEMLSHRIHYDVGVIDEIQMIGDPQRGFAWTSAVLGLCANEIHLCGEESAINVVKGLLEETGDELEVRRYERLTPLSVEEKSLDGSYEGVRRGDCVVAFSRPRIFEIKEEIERRSGLRCAVVYGKLPPEIRSEQAALFNDPNSGYDVIIGSDAIGMGLNLKIRRIIFDAVAKTDGFGRIIPLSISQTKQIAGRAGRYGHNLTGIEPGGYTTTLHEKDLPFLRDAVSHPSTPKITHARIGTNNDSFSRIVTALPPSTSLESVQMAHVYVAALPKVYKYGMEGRLAEVCAWVDEKSEGRLTWHDKQILLVSPVAWKDGEVMKVAEEMVNLQREEMCVDLDRMFGKGGGGSHAGFGFYDSLAALEDQMVKTQQQQREGKTPAVVDVKDSALELLESFHKSLVLYMWMHHRNCVVFPEQIKAEELKHRVEVVMDWALQQMGKKNVSKRWGQAKAATQQRQHKQHQWSSSRSPVRRSSIATTDKPVPSIPFPTVVRPQQVQSQLGPDQRQPQQPPKIDFVRNDPGLLTRRWEQPPDLSTLLKQYVDSPTLKIGPKS